MVDCGRRRYRRRAVFGLVLLPLLGRGVDVGAQDASVLGTWRAARGWPTMVAVHSSVLPDGRVLVWDRGLTEAGTEVVGETRFWTWDPRTNQASEGLNSTTNLFCSGHAFLAGGRLLVAGGQTSGAPLGPPHANVFDFRTNGWTRVSDMTGGRWYPTATAMASGEVLVASGNDENGAHNSTVQAFGGKGWRSLNVRSGDLYPWMFQAPKGGVFYAGPGVFTSFLDPTTGVWRDGPLALEDHGNLGSSVMYDGKVMNLGGGYGGVTAGAEVVNLNAATPRWTRVAPMAFPRRNHQATLLPDGTVLVTGGQREGGDDAPLETVGVREAERYDPATGAWSTLSAMSRPRGYHSTAVLLPDGRVLVAGSGRGAAVDQPNAEIYSPPYLFKGSRPTIATAPALVRYATRFSVETPDASNISAVRLIRLSSTTHSFNMNQRLNTLRFFLAQGSTTTLYVRSPGNANVAPPGHYLLFILNRAGVPSVAKIIALR